MRALMTDPIVGTIILIGIMLVAMVALAFDCIFHPGGRK